MVETKADIDDAQPSAPGRRSRPVPNWAGATAGVLAAAVALAASELFAAISDRTPSLVVAIGDTVIDRADATTTETAIDLFGTNDKPALIIGIVAISLLIGGITGVAGLRRRILPPSVFLVFGVVGAAAAARVPRSSPALGTISALVAAAIGWATFEWIITRSLTRRRSTAMEPAEGSLLRSDGSAGFDRRVFLGSSAGAAFAALFGFGGARRLEQNNSVAAEREAVAAQLPSAGNQVAPARAEIAEFEGVTPYIVPNDSFYRIDTALQVPQIDPAQWRLRVGGMVDRPYELTFDDVLAMDLVDATITISCVSNPIGGDLVGNAVWTGVPLTELLDRAGVQSGATQLVGRSWDGWTAGFRPSVLDDGRSALLAVAMNGEPLPIIHGFPARLVVAGLYGYVSAVKWVTDIELTTWEDFDGYWIPRGWAKDAPVKITSRIDTPGHGQTVPAGPVGIGGVAWAPTRGISRVELRIGDGPWVEADLGEAVSDETWKQWTFGWEAEPGTHRVEVRAYDADGTIQPPGPKPVGPDGAEGYHTILVVVDAA